VPLPFGPSDDPAQLTAWWLGSEAPVIRNNCVALALSTSPDFHDLPLSASAIFHLLFVMEQFHHKQLTSSDLTAGRNVAARRQPLHPPYDLLREVSRHWFQTHNGSSALGLKRECEPRGPQHQNSCLST
jgi:hypothetical protein